jgi:hypothetical protein
VCAQAGRFGRVDVGDMFLLVNDSLTGVLHVVALGNGHCAFQVRCGCVRSVVSVRASRVHRDCTQLRGLEFKGTFCQQREVEAVQLAMSIATRPRRVKQAVSLWSVVNTQLLLPAYDFSTPDALPLLASFTTRRYCARACVRACVCMGARFECMRNTRHRAFGGALVRAVIYWYA